MLARLFNAASIKDKLRRIHLATTGSAFLLATLLLTGYSLYVMRTELLANTRATAELVARNSTAALEFGDTRVAEELLGSLAAVEHVLSASVLNAEGKSVADYRRAGGEASLPVEPVAGHRFSITALDIVEPVRHNGRRVGAVLIRASQSGMYWRLASNAGMTALLVLAALLAAHTLISRLQRTITVPLSNLVQLMSAVSARGDFSLRAVASTEDELGELAKGFNEMLGQIQTRDSKLATHRDELEQEVEVRTAELREAKDLAEAGSRAKSDFLATMSHEIRTPMNGILGMTELLRDTSLSAQQRRFTDAVYQSGEHLLNIINDILDFSKIEAGKLEIESIHFNLRQLVEDVGYMFAKSAEAKGLEIACSVPHDAPVAVKGDPVRVRQIMTNLVNNAVKFTQEGEVVIRVKLLDENSEQARFRFEVQDTGIGISEQVQSRIFSAFAQADSSTTRRYGGTGLGLAIARRLVEMMHGRIGVTSEPDRGSVFWFEIPFIKQNPEARTMIDMAERLTGLRVLVVDDNATNREILAHQLTGWSMRYAGVDGGAAALRELERAAAGKAPFELVILDLHMPEMDGFELARSIRSNACFDGMPLVMLSSVSVSSDHPDRQAAPIDYYLTKPVRQSDLYDAISTAMSVTRVIERGSPSPALGQPPAALCGRVLVAEDNRVNQQVASAMLESLGLSCSIAGNGAVALERLRAERFELVLMDCQMPEMDGFAATAQIRSLQREGLLRPDLPVVALTANAVEGDRERCLAAGMDDYLSKPFTREQLGATLARWLPRSEPVAASASSPSSAAVSVSVDRAESPADEPIHRRALDAIRSLPGVDSEALVANVIGAYLADAPDQLARLCAASAGGDAQALHKTAHAMKSSSANLGAEHLAALCKDLEMLGQAGKLDAAAALLTDVEAELTRVLGALQTQVATQSEGVAPQPSSGPTALIVDDDQVMRMLQQQTLQQAQFDVREAADGEQALQMLAGPPPDLVLLDVDMPGVNGFEVCRRIRQRWDATEVPVIMVTGMDDLQSINQAYESGASDFISKPINWPILGYRARYVLRSAQAARNLRELEERQAAIVRAMPDMIFVLGRDGTYLDYKAGYGASRLVGPERFLGRNVVDVLPGDVSRQVLDGIARALEQGDVQSMVYKLAMPDGVHHYEGRIVRNGSDKVVAVVRDITLQTLYEERIQRLAYFDTLTGMPNRQQFVERLDNELERARRENRRLALLFLDLDGFKRVNDTLGHSAGDTLLQSVAERLKEKLRASDIVSRPGLEERGLHFARLGGDEFTVVLPDIQDIQVATQIAQRLQSVLDQPFRIDGEDITVTASIGISLFPEHGDDAATLLKHADTAMYHAKEQGRNNWKLYATALTTQAMSRLSLENDIRRALERGEFRLVYQPQVLAQDGTIVGMEALIRWQHPERGMVSPGEFIPVAEESGLIVPMGEWVIRSACEQVRSWQRGGVATPRVAVNVSARQVHAADFIDRVIAIITETGISADLLELELTESVLMNFDAQRLEGLHRLRALGAHFSIDDFGTGYSSLAYVKRFPIGMLKIDQSFVRGLPDSLDNAGITTAIIAMARSLGLDVIAEGVETREQRAFLSKAQCPKLQGYLFSPPVAPSEMERLLCQGFIVTPREALAA